MHRSVVFIGVQPSLTGEVIFAIFLVAKPIIALSLLGISQYLIGLGELLEILSSLLIIRVLVWVLQQCEFSVCFLDLLSSGGLRHTQYIIKNELFLLVTSYVISSSSFFDLFLVIFTIGFKTFVFLLLLLVFASGIFLHF